MDIVSSALGAQMALAALVIYEAWPRFVDALFDFDTAQAEAVNGVMVTDRATRGLEEAFWPPEFASTFREVATAAAQRTPQASHSAIALDVGAAPNRMTASGRRSASIRPALASASPVVMTLVRS